MIYSSFEHIQYWIPGQGVWQFTTLDNLESLIVNAWQTNKPLYRGVYYYYTPKLSNWCLFDLVLDSDNKENLEQARTDLITAVLRIQECFDVNPESWQLGFSGNKGFYARLSREFFAGGVIPAPQTTLKEFTIWLSSIAPSIDITFYNKARLFREPNTVHEGSGLYRIMLDFEELKSLSIDQIKAMAGKPRYVDVCKPTKRYSKLFAFLRTLKKTKNKEQKHRNKFVTQSKTTENRVTIDNLPTKYQHLSNGVSEGERNNAICTLVGVFKTCGLNERETLYEILEFNSRCRPPLPEKVVTYKIHKLF